MLAVPVKRHGFDAVARRDMGNWLEAQKIVDDHLVADLLVKASFQVHGPNGHCKPLSLGIESHGTRAHANIQWNGFFGLSVWQRTDLDFIRFKGRCQPLTVRAHGEGTNHSTGLEG